MENISYERKFYIKSLFIIIICSHRTDPVHVSIPPSNHLTHPFSFLSNLFAQTLVVTTTCNKHFGLIDTGETSRRRIQKYKGRKNLLPCIEIWINYRKTYNLRISLQCCWGFKSSGMWCHIQDDLLHCLTLEDEGVIILWNTDNYSPQDTASHPRRFESSEYHFENRTTGSLSTKQNLRLCKWNRIQYQQNTY